MFNFGGKKFKNQPIFAHLIISTHIIIPPHTRIIAVTAYISDTAYNGELELKSRRDYDVRITMSGLLPLVRSVTLQREGRSGSRCHPGCVYEVG
jgi:hypothetical protein